jgi:uncharacterized OsmC-like protein
MSSGLRLIPSPGKQYLSSSWEELVKLVRIAENGCIVANTLKAAVALSVQIV